MPRNAAQPLLPPLVVVKNTYPPVFICKPDGGNGEAGAPTVKENDGNPATSAFEQHRAKIEEEKLLKYQSELAQEEKARKKRDKRQKELAKLKEKQQKELDEKEAARRKRLAGIEVGVYRCAQHLQ